MTRIEQAVSKFLEGYNCAQSVFYSFCDDLGLEKNHALKIACGFGAGMGRKQEVCGAVSGGIMVLSARYGRVEKEDLSAQEVTYKKTRELMDKFAQKHGTYICHQLLNGCELAAKEGQKSFKENDLLHKVCIPCVQSVVGILEEIIEENPTGR